MGKVISIHSFRGGTGKSNVSANLAAQLVLAGRRVAVIDTDIYSPGIHALFGLEHGSVQHTLNEYLRGECSIIEATMSINEILAANKAREATAVGRSQLADKPLWLAPSSIQSEEIAMVLRNGYDVGSLHQGFQVLLNKLELDYLIIDTHPGLNEETLLSIALSDVLLLLLRPDQQDFQGTIVTVDVARTMEVPDVFLVVNKALTRYDFGHIWSAIEDRFGVPVAAVLPMNEDIVDLGSSDLFSLVHPDHPWSLGIRQITTQLTMDD